MYVYVVYIYIYIYLSRLSIFKIFPGEYFLCALRNTSELFEDVGKKPMVPIVWTLTSLIARI